jgi:hypothetical protein
MPLSLLVSSNFLEKSLFHQFFGDTGQLFCMVFMTYNDQRLKEKQFFVVTKNQTVLASLLKLLNYCGEIPDFKKRLQKWVPNFATNFGIFFSSEIP